MKLTLFTNFINHYQAALADCFYELLGDDFILVATEPIDDSFKAYLSSEFSEKKYLLNAYSCDINYEKALRLANESDIVIIGSAPDLFIKQRLKSNKITFRYSERWFKKGDFQVLSPRAWWFAFKNHVRYRKSNLYMLCASAYTANDVYKFFAFPGKCYKWGYFPKVNHLEIDEVLKTKHDQKFKMLWVARWIDWKHPEMAVKLALELKRNKYDFVLEMAGDGEMKEEILELIEQNKLNDHIKLLGNIQNVQILDKMRSSNAFIFTSDRGEGWGVVVNEAMSNGCTVVASHDIGSIPFLIENEVNGLVFKSKNLDSLFAQVEKLINNRGLCDSLAKAAYKTIIETWNPEIAASNFVQLSQSLLSKQVKIIEKGPCSKARPIRFKF
jgi:glycosyltransferase involved in cell wall biosynthesis